MKVQVCKGKRCSEKGAGYLETRLSSDIKKFSYDTILEDCLCQGNCKNAPNILIDGKIFERMNPALASQNLAMKLKQIKTSFTSNIGK